MTRQIRRSTPRFAWNAARDQQVADLYRQGLSAKDIAAQMGCSESAYYSRLQKLRNDGVEGLEKGPASKRAAKAKKAVMQAETARVAPPTPIKRAGQRLLGLAGATGAGRVPLLITLSEQNYDWLVVQMDGEPDDEASTLLNHLLDDDRRSEAG
ncbi:MAG: hypothetical protein Alpg2KO_14410 [Alphaproteobacteria bacterium]